MQSGYALHAADGAYLGLTAAVAGAWLLVEQGHLFRVRHALPCRLVSFDGTRRRASTSLPAEVVLGSPRLYVDCEVAACLSLLEDYYSALGAGPEL
jgi:hypothetical protein